MNKISPGVDSCGPHRYGCHCRAEKLPPKARSSPAKSFGLDTPYVPPPGNPDASRRRICEVMCSAVFMTGLVPDFAAENVGFFTAPYAERAARQADHRSRRQGGRSTSELLVA